MCKANKNMNVGKKVLRIFFVLNFFFAVINLITVLKKL